MVALPAMTAGAPARAPDAPGEPRHIVILNAADQYLPAFVALDRGVRAAIRSGHGAGIELYGETLDMHRFPREKFEREMTDLLRKKYAGTRVDVVVTVAPIALDFASRHRDEIWPGATIVFHSVPAALLGRRELEPRTIGVPVRLEFGSTLDLALRLQPQTRRIAVVAGTGDADRRNLVLAKVALERYAGRLDVRYIVGRTRAGTLAAVSDLPQDTVLLYVTLFRDGDGGQHVPREFLADVAAASPVPVFGVFETYIGAGIVAGSVVTYEAQGRRAGELATRVLGGEDPAAIGIQDSVAPRCIADWRQLRHWGIDERLLPEDCEVRFKEETAWDFYRGQILAVLVVLLAQSLLIAAMLVQRRRRRRADIAVQRLRTELFHATRLAAMGELTASIAHEVNQPLGAILANVDAADMLLDSENLRPEALRQILDDVRRDDLRASDVVRRLRALLAKHETERETLDVDATIADVLRLLAPESRRRDVEVETAFAGTLPAVSGDRTSSSRSCST